MFMSSRSMNHIDVIMNSVYRPEKVDGIINNVDPIILRSWKRCVSHFHLEPSPTRTARVLSNQELLDHKTPIEEFISIAKSGLHELHKHVSALDYVVLLTDKHGITIDYLGNDRFDKELRKSGLYMGSDWNETRAGTCAVGVCATEMKPVIAHRTDHFDIANTTLTCSAAPIFDPFGKPLAVLDVSSLKSPEKKDSQYILLQMVELYAHIIESANFLHHFKHENWVIRFGECKQYVEVSAPHMIAINETGEITGINASARTFLNGNTHWQDESWDEAMGKHITKYFDCKLDDIFANATSLTKTSPVKLKSTNQQFYFHSYAPHNIKSLFVTGRNNKDRPSVVSQHQMMPLGSLAGKDTKMDKSIRLARKLLNSRINFLIQGETGCGKELFAKAMHRESNRSKAPFIAVNCAAIPESLIESELFGYKPGSFTGAKSKGSQGLIQQSSGGTLFLDEIGDMPLDLQTRLLRVISEQEVLPLGSNAPISVDLNVISASHRCIESMINEKRFREDLYFRLAGTTLTLPPFRARQDKDFIIKNILVSESSNPDISIENEVLELLKSYSWPGNIRELKNILKVALALSNTQTITMDDIPEQFFNKIDNHQETSRHASYYDNTPDSITNCNAKSNEEKLIVSLKHNKWNITDTANDLGISRATIYRRMKRYNIVPPNQL